MQNDYKESIKETIRYSKMEEESVEIVYVVDNEEEKISGIVRDYTDELILIEEYTDFIFREKSILIMEYVVDLFVSNKTYSSILKNQISSSQTCPMDVNISSIQNIFKDLKSHGFAISLSSALLEKDYYKIGVIEGFNEDEIKLKTITADGDWGKEIFISSYQDITQISYGSIYNQKYYDFVTQT